MKNCIDCDYKTRIAKIINKENPCLDTVNLKLSLQYGYLDFNPGQFIMISLPGFGEIPLGIASSPKEKDYFEIAIKKVGNVTSALDKLPVGAQLGLRGPYGNGFDLEGLKNRDILIIAGGIGIAPLRSLIQYGIEEPKHYKSLQIIYGAKSSQQLIYNNEFGQWQKAAKLWTTVDQSDRNWAGHTGDITDQLERIRITSDLVAILCGPPTMYRLAVKKLLALGLAKTNIELLLERRMKCGVGKCQHCTFGEKYVCLDGPVFSWDEIENNQEVFK